MAANLQDLINWPKTETELSSGRNTNVFKIVNSTCGIIESRLFWTFLSASLYKFKAQPLTHIQMKPNLILTWICCSIRDKAWSHFEMIFQWHLKKRGFNSALFVTSDDPTGWIWLGEVLYLTTKSNKNLGEFWVAINQMLLIIPKLIKGLFV